MAWRLGRKFDGWEFQANGVLWRLLPARSGVFVGEDRDLTSKTVSFFCVDRKTGRLQWNVPPPGERWWSGVEAVHEKFVLLHEFAAPDLPDHRKIITLDLATGRYRWANAELKFLFLAGDSIYASRDLYDRREFFELDITDGRILREVDGASVNVLREQLPAEGPEGLVFPGRLDEAGLEAIVPAEDLIRRGEMLENAEHIAIDGFDVLSYHVREARPALLSHRLVVIRKRGRKVVHSDRLIADAASAVPDAFFAIAVMLYYVREKRTLCALDLSTGIGRSD